MPSRNSLYSLLLTLLTSLLLAGCGGGGSTGTTKTTPPASYQLTVTAPPSGAGTVVSSPTGINCPSGSCSATFASGTQVTLTATSAGSYTFAGWSGACSGTNSCSVTMTAAESVTPTYNSGYGVTVATVGSGSVGSSPSGIACPPTCSATFAQNTPITLTATPQTGGFFGGWSGAGCSGTSTCTFNLSASESVTASFNTGDVVAVSTLGTGIGTVTSNPAGITCVSGSATSCSGTFAANTVVTLTESVTPPNVFSGWSGACSGTGACSVTVSAATSSVSATFSPGTIQSLNHIIIYAQENRSFDHYFGYLRQYWANQGIPDQSFDGLPQFNPTTGAAPLNGPIPTVPGCDPAYPFIPTVPPGNINCIIDSDSPSIPSFHMQSVCTEEISPFWDEARDDWNVDFLYPTTIDEEMNGFVKAAANDARQYSYSYNDDTYVNDTNGYRSMGYFTDADLNFYYYMASTFATSDRWFSPVLSRTQLNRAYLIAGTSQGYAYPPGSNSNDDAAFTAQPIFEELQNAGITWRVYVDPNSTDPTDGTSCAAVTGSAQNKCLADVSYLNEFTYEAQIQSDPTLYQNFVPTTQFATDVQNDATFPQVVMIDPPSDSGLDEHPSDLDAYPENIQSGSQFAEGLITSFMYSPVWNDSAMIFTYDEGGGFYDHVPAQVVPAPDQYTYPIDLEANDMCDGANQSTGICSFAMTGYRIPLIVISPYAKQNYVSHIVRDTTAWLNLVEERFGVKALTARDAYWSTTTPVATMDEFFDFAAPPWVTPPPQSSVPAQLTNGTCSLLAPTP